MRSMLQVERIDDSHWFGVVKGLALDLEWNGKDLILHNTTEDDFLKVWYSYFDLAVIMATLKTDCQK